MYENYDEDEEEEWQPDPMKVFKEQIFEANNKLFELEDKIKELKNNGASQLEIDILKEEYQIIYDDYLYMIGAIKK